MVGDKTTKSLPGTVAPVKRAAAAIAVPAEALRVVAAVIGAVGGLPGPVAVPIPQRPIATDYARR